MCELVYWQICKGPDLPNYYYLNEGCKGKNRNPARLNTVGLRNELLRKGLMAYSIYSCLVFYPHCLARVRLQMCELTAKMNAQSQKQ